MKSTGTASASAMIDASALCMHVDMSGPSKNRPGETKRRRRGCENEKRSVEGSCQGSILSHKGKLIPEGIEMESTYQISKRQSSHESLYGVEFTHRVPTLLTKSVKACIQAPKGRECCLSAGTNG